MARADVTLAVVTTDREVRSAAFAFLAHQRRLHGEVLSWEVLSNGFQFAGQRVPLIGPQGIFKPAVMELPFSITTAPVVPGKERPYEDEVGADGLLVYRYRGTDPRHRDNHGLREAMRLQVPLAYFFGIVKGQYMPVFPVFIVGDNPAQLRFRVAFEDRALVGLPALGVAEASAPERRYAMASVKRRLHQHEFRERVLAAYQSRCAVCRLRHRELLEAAHILPDSDEHSLPMVSNGIALCKLHHAAFDSYILGIRPDLIVQIRPDVLRETDGPMLEWGLQGFEGHAITVPRPESLRPSAAFLAERYERFRKAG